MDILTSWFSESFELLGESAIYVVFGLVVGGLLRVFLSPNTVARHLGNGRFSSVAKAGLIGIPMPLCSCGVLPAAASLKKQGASNGATTAFLISTPETGVDSIAISYALLDPILTVMRPISAFFTAIAAGIAENMFAGPNRADFKADLSCPIDACCDGVECPTAVHSTHHSFFAKLQAGFRFAFGELWGDIASWFFVGMLLAGLISVLIPEDVLSLYLGGGLSSMLIMLAVGIPLYICATASTPIAAMLILKGVSPGAALVFLLAGPATNVTSLSVLVKVLGKRATVIYLASIGISSVLFGLLVDGIYGYFGVAVQATVGQAAEIIPQWMQLVGAVFLLLISIKPVGKALLQRLGLHKSSHDHNHALATHDGLTEKGCGLSAGTEAGVKPAAGST